jgi:hypothetical protein
VELPGYQFPDYPAGTTYELMCQYNPATTEPEVFLLVQEPLTREDGSHPDPLSELWSTSLRQTGWEKLTLIDKGLRNIVPMAGPSPAVFLQRPRTGYEYWTRNEGGDWDVMHLRLEGDKEEMTESAGYRVGITMKRNGETIGSGEVGITASVATTAIVQGRHGILGIHRPWKASADATGTLWITVLLEERTSFPDLVLTSALFSDRLVLDLNHRIQGFFSNVSEQQLLNARDPRRCREEEENGCSAEEISGGLDANSGPLITDREKAEKSAGMIRETLNVAPKPAQLSQSSSAQVTVESKIPWGWLPMSSDIRTLHPVMAANSGPSWRVYRKDGVAHLERVSSTEARTRMAELNVIHRPWEGPAYFGIFDFISDAFDAIADAARSVYDGACRLAEAVVDGLKITINLVYDGITWVYNAVMDTIDMVMDAIDFVLEFAGMALGMAVGWLLEQLGFLFDWKAIKQRRDQLRDFMSRNLGPALNKLGNPMNGAAAMKRTLDGMKGRVFELLNSMLANPGDRRAFSQAPGESGQFESFSFIRGVSVMPELTWLLDKLQSVLPKARGSINFPGIPAVEQPMGELAKALISKLTDIAGVLGDAAGVFEEWIAQGKLFTAEAFDPIIHLLMKLVGRVFDMFSTVLIDNGAKVLQALLTSARSIFDSFDNTMSVPAFFRGFYKGLSGNDCSALDAVCLLAAIPSYAEYTESPNNTAGMGTWKAKGYLAGNRSVAAAGPHLERASFHDGAGSPFAHFGVEGMPGMQKGGGGSSISDARMTAILFATIAAMMDGLSTGFMAASTPNDPVDMMSDIFGYAGKVATLGYLIANLVEENPWVLAGIGGFIALGLVSLGLYYKYGNRGNQVVNEAIAGARTTASDKMTLFLILAANVFFFVGMGELIAGNVDQGISGLISTVEFMFSVFVRERRREKPFGPYVAAGLGAGMAAMDATQIVFYALRPVSG